jgi:hypothetical protein
MIGADTLSPGSVSERADESNIHWLSFPCRAESHVFFLLYSYILAALGSLIYILACLKVPSMPLRSSTRLSLVMALCSNWPVQTQWIIG